ncbi:hypothetical protein MMB232_00726 [Brevundimonas subvibrioides]|uniref:hypothetical protein n=1 Tax=Brevundimonas subvibrioides TaxID=74313 RepID=UPI0032D57C70
MTPISAGGFAIPRLDGKYSTVGKPATEFEQIHSGFADVGNDGFMELACNPVRLGRWSYDPGVRVAAEMQRDVFIRLRPREVRLTGRRQDTRIANDD